MCLSFSLLINAQESSSIKKGFDYEPHIIKKEIEGKLYYNVLDKGIELRFPKELELVKYTDFNNQTHELYPWYGEHVVYLTKKKNLDPKAMYLLLAFSDIAWEKFVAVVGDTTPLLDTNYLIQNKSTIAILNRPECDKACAHIGTNGIELNAKTWAYHHLSKAIKTESEVSLSILPFYDMARNFAIFEKKLTIDDKKNNFNSRQLMVECFKALSYPYVCQEAELPIEEKGKVAFHTKEMVTNLHSYLTNSDYNIDNTILLQKDHTGRESHYLMSSILLFIAQNYGGYECVQRMWSSVAQLPKIHSVQDLMDNYFLMACFGAQINLEKLFVHNFKYRISDKTQQLVQEYEKTNFALIP